MLERFDHRPMLTAVLALSTTVLLVVVVTLLIMLPPAASPAGDSGGGKPAAPKVMDAGDAGWYGEVYGNIQPDAGGENYGWDNHNKAVCSVELARTGHGCQEGRPSQR